MVRKRKDNCAILNVEMSTTQVLLNVKEVVQMGRKIPVSIVPNGFIHTFPVTSPVILLVKVFTRELVAVMDLRIVAQRVTKYVYPILISGRVLWVPHSVIKREVDIREPVMLNHSVHVQRIKKNRGYCATINAQTRETKANTNTTVFSIGANPRVRLASRRVSMIDGSAPRGLTV
jgi:hypothetical protein